MTHAIYTFHLLCAPLPELLERLCNSRCKSKQLTEMAYGWCSVICENYSALEGAKNLLLLSLEIGFRCIDPRESKEANLVHTEHHQKLANIVFSSGDGEAIADLLCAWISAYMPQLRIYAEHIVGLHHLHPFSSRLRSYIIYAIELIGYQEFEQVGVEGFIRLLNELQVCAKDLYDEFHWTRLLLDTIQSPKKTQHLSLSYWELLVELAIHQTFWLGAQNYNPQIMISLQDAREWDKLKCWISAVWMLWPPEGGKTTGEDLEHAMVSLFHQQPGALQKLEEQMEQWSGRWVTNVIWTNLQAGTWQSSTAGHTVSSSLLSLTMT